MIRPEIIKLRDLALKEPITYFWGAYYIDIIGLAKLVYCETEAITIRLKNSINYPINDEEADLIRQVFRKAISVKRDNEESEAIKDFENILRDL